MDGNYQICAKCIMDTTLSVIQFDEEGICSCCRQYAERIKRDLHYDAAGQASLQSLIERIKQEGARRDYDCVTGVSGGPDSTYVAYLLRKKYDLRVLAVHLDNGWDAELAAANIEQTMKRLGIDLYTNVLNWEEFRDLQKSFLKSLTAHIEIPTDHAIWATLIRTAAAKGIRYIISGTNLVTEGVAAPAWLYDSKDSRFINAVQRQFGSVKLRTYPQLSIGDFVHYFIIKGIKWIPILNYVPYSKAEAKRVLIDELDWRDYAGKHYESIFTRFEHGYWLPQKFNIDMRRLYLSALILSGQMTRERALEEIQLPPTPRDQIEEDIDYVTKKLNLTPEEFEQIMAAPPKSHKDYPNNAFLWRGLPSVVNLAHKIAVRV